MEFSKGKSERWNVWADKSSEMDTFWTSFGAVIQVLGR